MSSIWYIYYGDNMKNKNGFTLIELLGVIAILGLLVGLATFATAKIIANSKNKTDDITIKNIKEAAISYYLDNSNNYKINNSNCILTSDNKSDIENLRNDCKVTKTINELINSGFLKGDMKNIDKTKSVIVYAYKDGNNIDYRAYIQE